MGRRRRLLVWSATTLGLCLVGAGSLAAAPWTDHPLAANTPIKKAHLEELRQQVTALRTASANPACNIGAAPGWTDPTLTAGVTTVKAAHLNELRTALTAVYTALGQPVPAMPTVAAGQAIQATHIMQLRQAIDTLTGPGGACSTPPNVWWCTSSAAPCTSGPLAACPKPPSQCYQTQALCEFGTNRAVSCPGCPNGVCNLGEDCSTCPADCPPVCNNNGICEAAVPNCEAGGCADCGACGNGLCDAGENGASCGQDCCDASTSCSQIFGNAPQTCGPEEYCPTSRWCRSMNGGAYQWITPGTASSYCDAAGEMCTSMGQCGGDTYYCKGLANAFNNAGIWGLGACSSECSGKPDNTPCMYTGCNCNNVGGCIGNARYLNFYPMYQGRCSGGTCINLGILNSYCVWTAPTCAPALPQCAGNECGPLECSDIVSCSSGTVCSGPPDCQCRCQSSGQGCGSFVSPYPCCAGLQCSNAISGTCCTPSGGSCNISSNCCAGLACSNPGGGTCQTAPVCGSGEVWIPSGLGCCRPTCSTGGCGCTYWSGCWCPYTCPGGQVIAGTVQCGGSCSPDGSCPLPPCGGATPCGTPGNCYAADCAGVCDGSARRDSCGVCNGNGSSCCGGGADGVPCVTACNSRCTVALCGPQPWNCPCWCGCGGC